MVTGLIAAVVLVLANGFFVAAEFVLGRIRPSQVQGVALSGGAPARSPRCVVVRELVAISVAIARASRTALLVTPLLRLSYVATKMFVDRELLAQSSGLGLTEPEEHEIARRRFAFSGRGVHGVMRPREEIECVALDAAIPDAVRRPIAIGHTRIAVCELVPHAELALAAGAQRG